MLLLGLLTCVFPIILIIIIFLRCDCSCSMYVCYVCAFYFGMFCYVCMGCMCANRRSVLVSTGECGMSVHAFWPLCSLYCDVLGFVGMLCV